MFYFLFIEIDNCETTQRICKTCIEGYTAITTNLDIVQCIDSSDYEAIKAIKENCFNGDPTEKLCYECIRDYFLDEKNRCKEMAHCKGQSGNKCLQCKDPYVLDKTTTNCIKKLNCLSAE